MMSIFLGARSPRIIKYENSSLNELYFIMSGLRAPRKIDIIKEQSKVIAEQQELIESLLCIVNNIK